MSWKDAIYEIEELDLFIQLTLHGLHYGLAAGAYVDVLRKVAVVLRDPDPFKNEADFQKAKAHAARLQTFAERQEATDFAYIYELGTVKLWSILEAMVAELALAELKDPQKSASAQFLRSLKGPLLEFMEASEEERVEFLFSELSNAVKAPLKQGVGKLEVILDQFGYGGPIDDSVRRTLFELSHVRNVIVHRRGIGDRAFLKACPWFPAKIGNRLSVSRNRFRCYSLAARWYVFELDRRIRVQTQVDDLPDAIELRGHFLNELRDLLNGVIPAHEQANEQL